MSEYNTQEQIEAYLYNSMSAKDRAVFEAALQHNTELAKNLREQRIDHQIMEAVLEEDLQKKLRLWDKELDTANQQETHEEQEATPKKPSTKKTDYLKYWIALLVALLLLGLLYFRLNKTGFLLGETKKTSSTAENQAATATSNLGTTASSLTTVKEEDLAEEKDEITKTNSAKQNIGDTDETKKSPAKKQKTQTIEPNQRAAQATKSSPSQSPNIGTIKQPETTNKKEGAVQPPKDSIPPNIAKADTHINGLNLPDRTSRSRTELSTTLKSDSTDYSVRYALGLLDYQEGDFDSAIKHLEVFGVIQTQYLYEEPAQFILCMAYLHNNDITEAKVLLDKIAKDNGHQYYDYAVKLKEGLAE